MVYFQARIQNLHILSDSYNSGMQAEINARRGGNIGKSVLIFLSAKCLKPEGTTSKH